MAVSRREGETERVLFALPDITDADIEAVTDVLRSGWLTTGVECLALEDELREHVGAGHVVTMASCTAALETTAAWLGVQAGRRVAVPTWTFVSSALAFTHTGARPMLLDVDANTLNVSLSSVEAALESGVDAVVVVHFGGVPVDEAIYERCRDAGVPVVEDAAHALGARDSRGPIAGHGTVGACYSFYASKNLTSGEGGALATDDAELADFARSYRQHGLSRDAWARYLPGSAASYDLIVPGIKANLPDLLAALGRSQLARFGQMQERRREIVRSYRKQLEDVAGLRFVPGELAENGADHLMVVLLPEGVARDEVVNRLDRDGIGTSVHFRPLGSFRWFQEHADVVPGGTPVADRLEGRTVSLPLHARLTDSDVARVTDSLRAALE